MLLMGAQNIMLRLWLVQIVSSHFVVPLYCAHVSIRSMFLTRLEERSSPLLSRAKEIFQRSCCSRAHKSIDTRQCLHFASQNHIGGTVEVYKYCIQFPIDLIAIEPGQLKIEHLMSPIRHFLMVKKMRAISRFLL